MLGGVAVIDVDEFPVSLVLIFEHEPQLWQDEGDQA